MPTATQITYYHLCHTKLWLFSRGMNMEFNSELVAEGKWIHETTYTRRSSRYKEIQIGNIKVDHYDVKEQVIHETKKSNKREGSHIAQLKYYMFRLEEAGIPVRYGILEYPKLREKEEVFLLDSDRKEIPIWRQKTKEIINQENCPKSIKKSLCKYCSYFDFCFSG